MDAFQRVNDQVGKKRALTDQESDWRSWKKTARNKTSSSARLARANKSNTQSLPSFPALRGGRKQNDSGDAAEDDIVEEEDVEEPFVLRNNKHESDGTFATVDDESQAKPENNSQKNDGDWVELSEPNTEKLYWFNNRTGETRQTKPQTLQNEEQLESQKEETPAESEPPTETRSARGWKVHPMDQVRNALKHHLGEVDNLKSGSSSKVTAKKKVTNKAGKVNSWIEIKDPITRKTYFADKQTGKTQWERPACLGGAPNGKVGSSKQTWERGVDNGKQFWYCLETGETIFGKKPT